MSGNHIGKANAANSIIGQSIQGLSPRGKEGVAQLKNHVAQANEKLPKGGSNIVLELAGLMGASINHPAIQSIS